MTEPLKPPYMPAMDEALRFMKSNPLTSCEMLIGVLGLGDPEKAEMSGGRFRELWKLGGGAMKGGRAWVEVDLLPQVLRVVIDADRALRSATERTE